VEEGSMNRRGLVYRLILAAAVFGAIIFLVLHRDFFQAGTLESELERFGHWAPIFFVLLYALATVLFVPGSAFSLAGGALFGPLWGTIWNLAGATIGATLAFLTARYLASDWVAKRSGDRLGRVIRGVEGEGWRFVAFVRLVPLFPFNLLNYALGLTRIRLEEYVLASFVCMAPGAIAYTYLGYAGREAVAGSAGAIRNGLIALGLLAAVVFLPRLVRRLRAPRGFIDTSELKRRLALEPQTVVIDVRGADEFDGPLGHIPGARNILFSELTSELQSLAALKQTPLVFICKTDKRSAKAADILRKAGFHQVSVLRGGMEQWNQDGLPIERSQLADFAAR
jgi:uncharacterized membrane protein YdjX (TVP38/TMEM64 family)/rhodanese-related sulfurtransferase